MASNIEILYIYENTMICRLTMYQNALRIKRRVCAHILPRGWYGILEFNVPLDTI